MSEINQQKRFLRIRKFDEYQHYKDRNPIWIKLYCGILEDYDFSQMSDETKFHAVGLMLLASRLNNKFPDDEKWLSQKINARTIIQTRRITKIRSSRLGRGFIQKFSETVFRYQWKSGNL